MLERLLELPCTLFNLKACLWGNETFQAASSAALRSANSWKRDHAVQLAVRPTHLLATLPSGLQWLLYCSFVVALALVALVAHEEPDPLRAVIDSLLGKLQGFRRRPGGSASAGIDAPAA